MNDDVRFERLFADGLHELAPSRAPDRLRTQIKTESGEVRPRARWLALIKEPPMRTNSRIAVGSPTARVAAILVATLLATLMLVSAGIAGSRLLAVDGPIVVDKDGSGTVTTITEAVAMAQDGDEILVRPGTYAESVLIDGVTVTISGEGGPGEVVLEAVPNELPLPELAPWANDEGPDIWAIVLKDTASTIRGLTIVGDEGGAAIDVVGEGAVPTLENLVVDQRGDLVDSTSVGWKLGGSGVLRNSTVEGYLGIEGSPQIIDNEMPQVCIDVWPDNAVETRPLLEGNTIRSCPAQYAIWVEDASAIIVGNDLMSEAADPEPIPGGEGRRTALILGPTAVDVEVSENLIHDSAMGIDARPGSSGVIRGNHLVGNELGINASSDGLSLDGNLVEGGMTGVTIMRASPELVDNEIRGVDNRGLAVSFEAVPILSGNVVCGNGEDVFVDDSSAVDPEGLAPCEDPAAD